MLHGGGIKLDIKVAELGDFLKQEDKFLGNHGVVKSRMFLFNFVASFLIVFGVLLVLSRELSFEKITSFFGLGLLFSITYSFVVCLFLLVAFKSRLYALIYATESLSCDVAELPVGVNRWEFFDYLGQSVCMLKDTHGFTAFLVKLDMLLPQLFRLNYEIENRKIRRKKCFVFSFFSWLAILCLL